MNTTYLRHQRFEVHVMWLPNNPVGIATQCPAGYRSNQCLLVSETANQIRDELGEVRDHAIHAALSDGAQDENARFLDLPVCVKQRLLQYRQQDGKYVISEHVCQNI